MQLWAGVSFTALGGQTAAFLQRAAQQRVKLRNIRPLVGGVSAQCSAQRYFALRKLARVHRVKLHITARNGAYFLLRKLFARKGLWAGALAFVLLGALQQNLIWQIDDSDLTTGQQARVAALLWEECGIAAGAYSSEALLAQAESVLLTSTDEFSWVSLNFADGRLTVEVTAATQVPEIAQGAQGDLVASVAGQVVSVNVQQGTPMVAVGQAVEAGQVLIATARLEYDNETLVYEPTAGEVLAEFSVNYTAYAAAIQHTLVPAEPLAIETQYAIFAFGRVFALPSASQWIAAVGGGEENDTQTATTTTRNIPLTVLGLPLPATILEQNSVYYQQVDVIYTQEELFALARLSCSEQLYAAYPNASIVSYRETIVEEDGLFALTIEYQIIADICSLQE